MYYTLRWTGTEYPFAEYFKEQIVSHEHPDTNSHFHAIISIPEEDYGTARKFIQRKATTPKQFSFVKVKNLGAINAYIRKESKPFIETLEIPAEMLISTYKDTHKKGETFVQFCLNTFERSVTGTVKEDIKKHVFACFIEQKIEISKTKFRNIYQTLLFHFSQSYISGYEHNIIPDSWTEIED